MGHAFHFRYSAKTFNMGYSSGHIAVDKESLAVTEGIAHIIAIIKKNVTTQVPQSSDYPGGITGAPWNT